MMAVDGRRLLRATGLGLAVFLLVGGGAGFAMASQGAGQTLSVPVPRPGDRATYAVTSSLVQGAGVPLDGEVPAEVVYEWLPERTVVDRTFAERRTHPLQVVAVYRTGEEERRSIAIADFDAVTGDAVRTSQSGRFTTRSVAGQAADPLLPPTDNLYANDFYGKSMDVPCAMRSSVQGALEIPADVVMGGCGWAGQPEQAYTPFGWERLANGPAYRFDSATNPLLHAWFETGSPFPVQVTSALREILGSSLSAGRLFTLVRTAWAPGMTDYSLHEDASLALPNPAALVPRVDPWMLDDSGLANEFSLGTAYAVAEAAPRARPGTGLFGSSAAPPQPSVREWLAQHPDGYLAQATRFQDVDAYYQSYLRWSFVWVDDGAWLGKVVNYAPQTGDSVPVPNTFLPEPAPKEMVVADWTPAGAQWLQAYIESFPPRDVLPTRMPAAAEVADRFLETTRPGPGGSRANVTYYGFRFTCEGPTRPCPEAGIDLWAGEARYTPTASSSLARIEYDSLNVDGDGSARSQSYRLSEAQPILGVGAATHEGTPPRQPGKGASLWVPPTAPATATGISFVAVAAATIYYSWPAIKGSLGLGLFSRVQPAAVLDHPTRRRIFEAIQAEPGIHFMALGRKADVGRGALDHHLRKLAAADLVMVRKAPGYTCYFAKGRTERHLADAAPALRSAGSRAVFEAVRAEPGISCREVARRLGRSPSTVSYHLQRLQESGLVFGVGAGVKLSPLGEQAASAAA